MSEQKITVSEEDVKELIDAYNNAIQRLEYQKQRIDAEILRLRGKIDKLEALPRKEVCDD